MADVDKAAVQNHGFHAITVIVAGADEGANGGSHAALVAVYDVLEALNHVPMHVTSILCRPVSMRHSRPPDCRKKSSLLVSPVAKECYHGPRGCCHLDCSR